MKPHTASIMRLGHEAVRATGQELAQLLKSAVDDGAGIGFMAPLQRDKAEAYWAGVAEAVADGRTLLFVAFEQSRITGTAQLQIVQWPNQPHRAEIAKIMVAPGSRRKGIGRSLLTNAEAAARAMGRTLLVLDTESGSSAERLYLSLGWQKAGIIPDFALRAHGGLTPTTYMFKRLT